MMAHPKQKQVLFAFSPILLILIAYGYVLQTAPGKLKPVTIQSRIYEQNSDGTITETGTQTAYLSQDGSWSTVRRDNSNKITQVLIADATRGGVFQISSDKAVKLADFSPTANAAVKAEDYRKSSQYAGEVKYLGYQAYIQRAAGEQGEIVSEYISIPEFIFPVKTIDYLPEGTKRIIEAISITEGEPAANKVRVVVGLPVVEQLLDPHPKSKN